MKFDWKAVAEFIARLSALALQWFREVNRTGTNPGDEYRIRKTVSVVIDPDTPEENVDQVEVE